MTGGKQTCAGTVERQWTGRGREHSQGIRKRRAFDRQSEQREVEGASSSLGSTAAPHKRRVCLVEMEERELERVRTRRLVHRMAQRP